MLDDGMTRPAEVVAVGGGGATTYRITLREGRKRQVRRMFEAVGHPVTALHRESFGPIELGDLEPGAVRDLTPDEVDELRESVR